MPDLMWALELRSLGVCSNCLTDGAIWDISLGPIFVFQFLFFETGLFCRGGWPGTYCVAYLTSDSWQLFFNFWNVRVRYFGTHTARWNALPLSSIPSSLRFSMHCGLIPQQYPHVNPPLVTFLFFPLLSALPVGFTPVPKFRQSPYWADAKVAHVLWFPQNSKVLSTRAKTKVPNSCL